LRKLEKFLSNTIPDFEIIAYKNKPPILIWRIYFLLEKSPGHGKENILSGDHESTAHH